MKDVPILFSAPMIRALLDGRKTMTRRSAFKNGEPTPWQNLHHRIQGGETVRFWVRENFRLRADQDDVPPSQDWWKSGAWYDADGSQPTGCGGGPGKLRPCIFMPRWASRITIVEVQSKIERLHAITKEDAEREGIYRTGDKGFLPPNPLMWAYEPGVSFDRPTAAFNGLWRSLHGDGSWAENPTVCAFWGRVVVSNIDQMEAG